MSSLSVTNKNVSHGLKTVDFHGQTLLTLEKNNVIYTAIKPICENIGLNWNGQRQRIQRDEVLSKGACMINTPSKGGVQAMLCLPIKYLNGWLFGVDANRVKPEIKERLIEYKEECYQVLHDYWHKGIAVNPRFSSVDDRKPLVAAVKMYCRRNNAIFSDTWKMVHQRFNVENVEQLTVEQIPKAVEYVHWLILKSNSYNTNAEADRVNAYALSVHMMHCKNWFDSVKEPLEALNPEITRKVQGHFLEGMSAAKMLNRSICEG